MPLTKIEATQIATQINPLFNQVLNQYDFAKYPAAIYATSKVAFSTLPANNNTISDALLWKWGHWGKANYPQSHRRLIAEVSENWGDFVRSAATTNSEETFNWWHNIFDRNTTYITEAYITHLVVSAPQSPTLSPD